MSRKYSLPKFPESYVGEKSQEYNDSLWMERNQKKTTLSCINYLHDEKLDKIGNKKSSLEKESIILDLGCGSGFSSEVLSFKGFRVVAIDILIDMLNKARQKKKEFLEYENIEFVLADINNLPFRENSFDNAISVSAYNFIIFNLITLEAKKERLTRTARLIFDILKPFGKVIIEFYPKNQEELELFSSSFSKNRFKGYYIKANEIQKGGKTFLLMRKIC